MIELDVTIQSDALIRDLQRRGIAVRPALEQGIEQGANRIHAALRLYPSPPPNSTYQRTYALRRGWQKRSISYGDVVGRELSNAVGYAPYVQGHGQQAAIHQRRWRSEVMILDELGSTVLSDIQGALMRAL